MMGCCCSRQCDGDASGAGEEDVHLRWLQGPAQGGEEAQGQGGGGGHGPRQGDGGAQGQDAADGEDAQVSPDLNGD